jgi:hypothetical protein
MMMDFIEQNSRDPYQYVDQSNSLLEFSTQHESSFQVPPLNLKLLSYLGKHVCDGKRLEDAIILKLLILKGSASFLEVQQEVEQLTQYKPISEVILFAIYSINLHYVTQRLNRRELPVSEVTGFKLIKVNSSIISLDKTLQEVFQSPVSKRYYLDLFQCAIHKFLSNYSNQTYQGGFKLEGKYSRKDIFRILGWKIQPNELTVGGYLSNSDNTICPIFLTYKKDERIAATIKYEDRFINPSHLIYMSKKSRSLNSPDVTAFKNQALSNMRIPLFVKKSDDEGSDFYYLGELTAIPDKFENSLMQDKDGAQKSVVKMEFLLDKPIEHSLFRYLTDADLSHALA